MPRGNHELCTGGRYTGVLRALPGAVVQHLPNCRFYYSVSLFEQYATRSLETAPSAARCPFSSPSPAMLNRGALRKRSGSRGIRGRQSAPKGATTRLALHAACRAERFSLEKSRLTPCSAGGSQTRKGGAERAPLQHTTLRTAGPNSPRRAF